MEDSKGDDEVNLAREWSMAIVGAILGGVVGHFAFELLLSYGFYGAALPGAFVGLGAGMVRRRRSVAVGIVAAGLALFVGVYSELDAFTFGDGSLAFFLKNPQPVPWLMLAVGTVLGFVLGVGRSKV
jgi:hypothetical protein